MTFHSPRYAMNVDSSLVHAPPHTEVLAGHLGVRILPIDREIANFRRYQEKNAKLFHDTGFNSFRTNDSESVFGVALYLSFSNDEWNSTLVITVQITDKDHVNIIRKTAALFSRLPASWHRNRQVRPFCRLEIETGIQLSLRAKGVPAAEAYYTHD
jgi:hypothetical protein